jgi:hypothetical protein
MTLYLFNATVLAFDDEQASFNVRKIDIEEAKKLTYDRLTFSAIGHESTAVLLSNLFGFTIPVSRINVTLDVGDEAIIFKLKNRIPEGKILSLPELEAVGYEFLHLVRTA